MPLKSCSFICEVNKTRAAISADLSKYKEWMNPKFVLKLLWRFTFCPCAELIRRMTFKKCERVRMLCCLASFQGLYVSLFLLCLVSWKDCIRILSKEQCYRSLKMFSTSWFRWVQMWHWQIRMLLLRVDLPALQVTDTKTNIDLNFRLIDFREEIALFCYTLSKWMFHSSFYLAFISSFPLLFPFTMGFEVGCFSSICFPVNLALFPANWSNPSMGSGSFKEASHVEIISCSYNSQSLNLSVLRKLGRILDIHLKFYVSPFSE